MGRQPESREIRVQILAEHRVQIGFDVGRPGQADVISQKSQRRPVRHHAPQAAIVGVQELLHSAVRCLPPPLQPELPVRLVKVVRPGDQQHRHGVLASAVRQGKESTLPLYRLGGREVVEAEDGLEQRNRPLLLSRAQPIVPAPLPPFRAFLVQIASHAPVTGHFIPQGKGFRQPVVRTVLVLRLQSGDRVEQEAGRQDRPLGLDSREALALSNPRHVRLLTDSRPAGTRRHRSDQPVAPVAPRSAGP